MLLFPMEFQVCCVVGALGLPVLDLGVCMAANLVNLVHIREHFVSGALIVALANSGTLGALVALRSCRAVEVEEGGVDEHRGLPQRARAVAVVENVVHGPVSNRSQLKWGSIRITKIAPVPNA